MSWGIDTCDACSGPLSPGKVRTCGACGAIHGAEKDLPVKLDAPMEMDCMDQRYFSMVSRNGRFIHGWFNPANGRVVQIG